MDSHMVFFLHFTFYSLRFTFHETALLNNDSRQCYRFLDVSHNGVRGNDGQALLLQTCALVCILSINHKGIEEVLIQGSYSYHRNLDSETTQQTIRRSLDRF